MDFLERTQTVTISVSQVDRCLQGPSNAEETLSISWTQGPFCGGLQPLHRAGALLIRWARVQSDLGGRDGGSTWMTM